MDTDILKTLVERAKGDASITKFAQRCNISQSNLSRILNNNTTSPTVDTLKKIADNSNSRVSYEELLEAAGYTNGKVINTKYAGVDAIDIELEFLKLKRDLEHNRKKVKLNGNPLSKTLLDIILSDITSSIENAKKILENKNSL